MKRVPVWVRTLAAAVAPAGAVVYGGLRPTHEASAPPLWPYHGPYKLLQVPFAITNNGHAASPYSVYFTMSVGDGAAKKPYRQVATSGGLAPHHTLATQATIGGVSSVRSGGRPHHDHQRAEAEPR